jgi:4-amino-4-deoxy-L-arabinose transferase-like glycosyltransferase
VWRRFCSITGTDTLMLASTDTNPAQGGLRVPTRVWVPHRTLLAILALSLAVRLLLVWAAAATPTQIVDEQHYATLAANLVAGHGLAWGPDEPTSIRPPLYPAFVAALWSLTGPGNLLVVRLAQIPLALLSVVVLYLIGRRLFDTRTALLAAAGLAFYPSLLFSGVLVLTETLFTLLLLLTILGAVTLFERPTLPAALMTGAALAAAALTRSVMWPFILLMVPLALAAIPARPARRVALAGVLVVGYLAVIAPWAVRNTRLQETFTVVDTMGGLNLMMGNYAYTPEDRPWDAISLEGDRAWSHTLPPARPDGRRWTEGTKEKWAQAQARAYILANPWITLRRSALKFADFWGLERDFFAGVYRGLYSPPAWFAALAALSTVLAFILAATLGAAGAWLAPPASWRAHALLVLLVLFVTGIHTLVFGHARYHLPLVPILLLYAAAFISRRAWDVRMRLQPRAWAAAVTIALLASIWGREILVRDADRLVQMAERIGLR